MHNGDMLNSNQNFHLKLSTFESVKSYPVHDLNSSAIYPKYGYQHFCHDICNFLQYAITWPMHCYVLLFEQLK